MISTTEEISNLHRFYLRISACNFWWVCGSSSKIYIERSKKWLISGSVWNKLYISLVPLRRLQQQLVRTEQLGLHLLRAFLNAVSMFLFFTGLAVTALAKVTALSFTSPLFMAVLSVIILGERMRIRRWTATLLGFVGMLVIVRPGFIELDTGSIMIIASSAIWAVTMIVIKVLLRTDTSFSVTGYASIFVSLFALPPAIYFWQNPSLDAWMWMVFVGVLGASAQFLLAEALREADAGAIMPFDFLKLVWASLFGFYLFAEIPDAYTWLGASIIFSSGCYIAYRESVVARKERKAATDAVEPTANT